MSYNQPPCPSGNPRIFVHCIDIFPKPIVLTCCQVGQVEALFAEQDPKLGKKYSFIKVDDKRSHGFQIIWYSSDILMNQDCHIKIEELPPSLQQSQKDHVLFGVVRFIQFLPVHDAIQKHAFLVGVLRVQRTSNQKVRFSSEYWDPMSPQARPMSTAPIPETLHLWCHTLVPQEEHQHLFTQLWQYLGKIPIPDALPL